MLIPEGTTDEEDAVSPQKQVDWYRIKSPYMNS